MRRLTNLFLLVLLTPAMAMAETVTGTVTYLQRMMLPPDAVVEILLQDVSLADAPAKTLGTFRIEAPGAPPYRFAFEYDPATIDVRNTYSLRATVTRGDRLMMTTDTFYPVITRGAGNEAEMVMKMVADPASAKPDSDFINTYWKILTLKGEPVPVTENEREPHVILRTDGSYNATVGCNMIRGAQEVNGAKVSFKPGAMTMMACLPPLDRFEHLLVETLTNASGFAVRGETMELVDSTGSTLATFVAVYF